MVWWYLSAFCVKRLIVPESIQPFWISREPVAWPWWKLAASQRRPYCAIVNIHSPVRARQSSVIHRWLTLCTVGLSHFSMTEWADKLLSWQCACPYCNSHASFFGKASHHTGISGLSTAQIWQSITSHRSIYSSDLAKHHITQVYLQPRFVTLWLNAFPKAKITIERMGICESDCHTVHKLSQRRLTADWRVSRESDCSQMRSKVSSDWLWSYIKAIWPVLEIFKMALYFMDSPRVVL
jgi:hypothetical protein